MGLRQRGKALENLYFHEEELSFRLHGMRSRLMGLWAASLMHKDDANSYASEFVAASIGREGDDAMFNKLHDDFVAAGVGVTDDVIHDQMTNLLRCAADELRNGIAQFDNKRAA